jgi:hypothetical protein
VNRTARRRLLRQKAADHQAAGTYVSKPRRSHYQTADIRDVVQADLLEMRKQIEAQRRPRDQEWAYREASARAVVRAWREENEF